MQQYRPAGSPKTNTVPHQAALIVDDDISYRQIISETLIEDGWDVVEAATGEDALTLLTPDTKVAVLVTDINLGAGMDGWTLGRLARDRQPNLGLLFISGENQLHHGCQHNLPGKFLLKPFLLSDFLCAVVEATHTDAAEAQPEATTPRTSEPNAAS